MQTFLDIYANPGLGPSGHAQAAHLVAGAGEGILHPDGANACLLGRPHVYALALAGADGVRQVIDNLVAELDLIMGLSGVEGVTDIGREQIHRAREAL